jgi:hypothetical protein
MAQMGLQVGVTPDREKVTIAMLEDGKQIGWIEFNGAQCDDFASMFAQYRAMLTDVPPGPKASESIGGSRMVNENCSSPHGGSGGAAANSQSIHWRSFVLGLLLGFATGIVTEMLVLGAMLHH